MNAKGERQPNRLKQRLNDGKVCIGVTLTLNNPQIAELYSHLGFDWLWIETEHTSTSLNDVLHMLQTTNGSECSTIVRVPWNDKNMIKRALDTGPDGIIIPLITTKEEAEAAVKAMKYPPWGERGAGLSRAQAYGMKAAEYMSSANDEVMTILMIEHIEAVINIDSILSVQGVDSVMIGALDLSGTMGMLGQTDHPDVEEAIQTVLAASKKADIPCGIITITADQANKRIEEGFLNIILGLDVIYLLGGASDALSKVNRPE